MLLKKSQGALVAALAVSILVFAATGCSDDPPTSPDSSDLQLSGAKISVDGQSLGGMSIHQGEYMGATRFEAHLVDHMGELVPGGQVRVQYGMSGMMGGHMNGGMGEFDCYDDGTHGDLVAGDGIYCFEDTEQQYGCHGDGASPGQYHYSFMGFDQEGQASNHMDVMVTMMP